MAVVYELVQEYREGRKNINKVYDLMSKDDPKRKLISGIVRDMTFVIDWLETGRMPGQIKGIEKGDVYRIQTQKKPLQYGVTGYWDESVNAFVAKNSYTDPFQEVEDKIDREMELNKRARSSIFRR